MVMVRTYQNILDIIEHFVFFASSGHNRTDYHTCYQSQAMLPESTNLLDYNSLRWVQMRYVQDHVGVASHISNVNSKLFIQWSVETSKTYVKSSCMYIDTPGCKGKLFIDTQCLGDFCPILNMFIQWISCTLHTQI